MSDYMSLDGDISFTHNSGEQSKGGAFKSGVSFEYELYFMVRGRAEAVVEGRRYDIGYDNAVLVLPGQYRKLRMDEREPYEYYAIIFSPSLIPVELVSELQSMSGCYCIKPDAAAFFQRLDYHINNYGGKHMGGLFKCGFREILYYICEQSTHMSYTVANEMINKVIGYINNNLTSDFTLHELCRDFKYSESYICSEVKNYMNMSVMKYVKIKRVLLSASLIARGEKPNEIYKKCGFTDYSTFYRSYKSVLDRIPSSG